MNEILKDHFLHPRNIGVIKNPTYSAIVKSDTCNDIVKMMVVLGSDDIIEDIRVEVFGCGYSISGASFFSDIARGKNIEDVLPAVLNSTRSHLSDVPDKHESCIALSGKAFRKILDDYKKKTWDGDQ